MKIVRRAFTFDPDRFEFSRNCVLGMLLLFYQRNGTRRFRTFVCSSVSFPFVGVVFTSRVEHQRRRVCRRVSHKTKTYLLSLRFCAVCSSCYHPWLSRSLTLVVFFLLCIYSHNALYLLARSPHILFCLAAPSFVFLHVLPCLTYIKASRLPVIYHDRLIMKAI
jgi:hypothetical protein